MTNFIFAEHRKGHVSHTGASKLLAGNPLLQELVGMICKELWPAATRVREVYILQVENKV